jgi:hypothetical protein
MINHVVTDEWVQTLALKQLTTIHVNICTLQTGSCPAGSIGTSAAEVVGNNK